MAGFVSLLPDFNAASKAASAAAAGKKVAGPKPTDAAIKSAADKLSAAQKIANNIKPPSEPINYQWNLPPHQWSLPVKTREVEGKFVDPSLVGRNNVTEQYRRGRMWWYDNTNNTYVTADGTTKTQVNDESRKYGFQFPWNPEAFTTSVNLNTDVTPTPADRFASVAGAFPSGETISFTLRLDRTNDFACMRDLLKKNYSLKLNESSGQESVFEKMASYYTMPFALSNVKTKDGKKVDTMGAKIKNLMEIGTVADIEYLYTAINGPGWSSVSGRLTGDIGYLSATLLRVDIGPLSYVGYVNSLSVNHIGFSEDMTPIRTDVQVSVNLMASAGIASDGVPAPVAVDNAGKTK